MEELLEKDICWVKITYPDDSVFIFRGTTNVELCASIGAPIPQVGEITNVEKMKIFYVDPSFKVECSVLRPSFNRRIDEYVNQFIQ